MDNIDQHSSNLYTILNDRILWIDGDSSYTVKSISDKILSGSRAWKDCYVIDSDDFSVKQFNKLNEDVKFNTKQDITIDDNSFDWNIPDVYKSLPIDEVLRIKLENEFKKNNFTDEEKIERLKRVSMELNLWTEFKMLDLLRTLMYIVDTFVENNIIWGTGRGSSCCSYILYLIGIHDVDSIFYDLDIKDFFRA